MRHSNGNPPRTTEPHGPLNIAKKRIFGVIYCEKKKYIPLDKSACNKKKKIMIINLKHY
ncbi:hypothetical protein NRF40_000748 [Klebsiella pneumoniae]|nr:hypothetical protein [Klebsiella pneumoniae]